MYEDNDRIDPLAGPGAEHLDEDTRRVLASSRTSGPKKTAKAKSDQRRTKATYDLPADLQTAIAAVAKAENCSRSALVAWVMGRFIGDYRNEHHDLRRELRRARQPIHALRWKYTLKLPDDDW